MLNNNFDISEMDLEKLKDVIILLTNLMNHEHDRLTILQNRVTELEINCNKKESK